MKKQSAELDELEKMISSQEEAALSLGILQTEDFAEVESEILNKYRKVHSSFRL